AASAEEWLETASQLERELAQTRAALSVLRAERDDLDIELAMSDEEGIRLRAQVRQMQGRLVEAQLYDAAFADAVSDDEWAVPPSLVELATLLQDSPGPSHPAFSRVEFTGDMRDVEAVQKRDPVGRYVSAFWEF